MKAASILLAAPLLLGVFSLPCKGQDGISEEVILRADSLLLKADRPLESLEVYRQLLSQDPQRFDLLWRASRACLVLGVREGEWERRKEWHREGGVFAHRAELARPSDTTAIYWRIANLGRWAQEEPSAREVLRLAAEVRSGADQILRIDPNHAGAHNALGMFYFEILHLSGFKRAIAGFLAPSVVRNIRWADAHDHLRRAVALDPENILFLKDYGRALLWHGDTLEARAYLQRAVSLPLTRPNDPIFLREARGFLEKAGG